MGGTDDNNEPIVAAVDESKYFHRKYHRSQQRENRGVLMAWKERQSEKCFLIEVPDYSENATRNHSSVGFALYSYH